MCHTNRVLLALGAVTLCFAATGRPASAEDEGSVKIQFPKEESVAVDLQCGTVELKSVRIEEVPSDRDLKKAYHDRTEASKLRWIFKVDNSAKHARKVKIEVKVYSDDKETLTEGSRKDKVSGRAERDHISVWTKMLTIDYPKASQVRVSAECERD